MNSPLGPPRFVPTLTDIVQPPVRGEGMAAEPAKPDTLLLQEQLIERVMQRIDLTLDKRLREALGQVILAQTQNLLPLLRDEIELVVRESVCQAVGHELP